MRLARLGMGAVLALTIASACRQSETERLAKIVASPTATAREARMATKLSGADSAGDPEVPLARWMLPTSLNEISGLALTSDGRLLVHGDESAQVWEIDYRRGLLVKRFSLGANPIKGDFEGITIANDVVWLLDSKGKLYEFKEGPDDAHVDFRMHDTGLKKDCEFEGLAYDPTLKALLLACKNIKAKADRNAVIIYRWSLAATDSASRLTRMLLPVSSVRGGNSWNSLQVSDITVDPATGNYVLIASKERAIIEISPAGEAVSARSLPEGHEQPEGVAIAKSLLLVSDEAAKGQASITIYRWP